MDDDKPKKIDELINEKNFYNATINSLPGIFYIFNDEGNFIRWNRNLEIVTEYRPEEISKLHPLDVFDEEDKKVIEERINETFVSGQSSAEAHLISKSGKRTPFYFSGHRMQIKDKNYLVGMGIDISDLRKTEAIAQKERSKAENYFDIADIMLIVIDSDEKVSLINQKGRMVLGGREEDIVGKNWFETFIPETMRENTRKVFRKLMAGEVKSARYYENLIVPYDGFQRMIAWHNTILKDASGNIVGTLSSGEDITDRKRMEKEIKSRMDELESFYTIAVGRELKMKELKKEIEKLKEDLSKK